MSAASEATLLATDELAAGYDGRPAISEVSFAARAGERIAVLGPNGGGKTTLFRVLLGELRPAGGTLEVRASTGTVAQTERTRLDYPVSAEEVALMGALGRLPWWRRPGRAERQAARAALATVGLQDETGRSYGELSGGQRQRVLIARALVQDARVLLLDEPFGGLDASSAASLSTLIDRLAGEGRAVLIATHEVDQARGWDRVLCLNRRQIAFGPPAKVLRRAVLEATYGASLVDLPDDEETGERFRAILPPHHHLH